MNIYQCCKIVDQEKKGFLTDYVYKSLRGEQEGGSFVCIQCKHALLLSIQLPDNSVTTIAYTPPKCGPIWHIKVMYCNL